MGELSELQSPNTKVPIWNLKAKHLQAQPETQDSPRHVTSHLLFVSGSPPSDGGLRGELQLSRSGIGLLADVAASTGAVIGGPPAPRSFSMGELPWGHWDRAVVMPYSRVCLWGWKLSVSLEMARSTAATEFLQSRKSRG